MLTQPKILLTNDDGIDAPGIKALYNEFLDCEFDILVVAPESERSAVGHAITLLDPLRVKKVKRDDSFFGYSVNGTPADCVKIVYWDIFKQNFDMVVSGINLGANTGVNMLYSGTVSAATEGAILGIPSFAISLATFKNPNFVPAANFGCKIAKAILKNKLPKGVYLNINIPSIPEHDIQGVSVTRQGKSIFKERFDKRFDPRGNTYYWLSGQRIDKEEDVKIDEGAIQKGFISVTPVHFDFTHYDSIEQIEKWKLDV